MAQSFASPNRKTRCLSQFTIPQSLTLRYLSGSFASREQSGSAYAAIRPVKLVFSYVIISWISDPVLILRQASAKNIFHAAKVCVLSRSCSNADIMPSELQGVLQRPLGAYMISRN